MKGRVICDRCEYMQKAENKKGCLDQGSRVTVKINGFILKCL